MSKSDACACASGESAASGFSLLLPRTQKRVFIEGYSFKNAAGSDHVREVLIAAQCESIYVCERDEAWGDHDRKYDLDILTRHFLLVILVCIISNPWWLSDPSSQYAPVGSKQESCDCIMSAFGLYLFNESLLILPLIFWGYGQM